MLDYRRDPKRVCKHNDIHIYIYYNTSIIYPIQKWMRSSPHWKRLHRCTMLTPLMQQKTMSPNSTSFKGAVLRDPEGKHHCPWHKSSRDRKTPQVLCILQITDFRVACVPSNIFKPEKHESLIVSAIGDDHPMKSHRKQQRKIHPIHVSARFPNLPLC